MSRFTGLPIAFCGSDSPWQFVSHALSPSGIAVRRYAIDRPRAWTGGRFELVILELATGDGDAVEQLRRVNRFRAGVPLLVLYGLDPAAQAVAARAGAGEGVVVRRWLPGIRGEEQALARFVDGLLTASPAFCVRTILRRALEPTGAGAVAFATTVVDRLAAGKGVPRNAGARRAGVSAVAREVGISLRTLEEALRRRRLPPPAELARLVAVLYTALLACSRDRSLEWAARQAGLSPERVRQWRRGLGLRPGSSPDEVVATALRALAARCEMPRRQLTALARRVTAVGDKRAPAAGA